MSYRYNGDFHKYDKYPKPNRPQTQNSVLYVTNFPRQMNKKKFQSLFCPFGRAKDICIFSSPKIAIPYAFVQYDDLRDAVQAKNKLNGSLVEGSILKVEYKKAKPTPRPMTYNHQQYYSEQPKFFPNLPPQSPLMQTSHSQQPSFHTNMIKTQQQYKNEDILQKFSNPNSNCITQNSSQYLQPPFQYGNYQKQHQNIYNNSIKLSNVTNPYLVQGSKINQIYNPEAAVQKNININQNSAQQANTNKQKPIIQTNITQNTIVGSNNDTHLAMPTVSNIQTPQKNEIQIVMNKPTSASDLNNYDYKHQHDRQYRKKNRYHQYDSSFSSRSQSSFYSSRQQRQRYHKPRTYANENERSQSSSRRERQINRNRRHKKYEARSKERGIHKRSKNQRSRLKYDEYNKRRNDEYLYRRDDNFRQFQNQQVKPNHQCNQQLGNIQQNKSKLSQYQRIQHKNLNQSYSSTLQRDSPRNTCWMDSRIKQFQNNSSMPTPNQNILNHDSNNFNLPIQIPTQPNPWQLQSQIVSLYKMVQRQATRISELQIKLDNLTVQNRINPQHQAQNLKDAQNVNKDFEKIPR